MDMLEKMQMGSKIRINSNFLIIIIIIILYNKLLCAVQ